MWEGYVDFRHFDKDGELIWEALDQKNDPADEGEYAMLDVFLRNGTAPAGFYLRLFNDTPVKTDTLGDLTGEPTGDYGYAAKAVARDATGAGWPTIALDLQNYMATSLTVTFTASGGVIGPVIYMVLATTSDNTGKLIGFVALSTTRTLADGESLQCTYKVKLQPTA